MSDSYQAIYDAVRSRISGGDIGQIVESAVREAFGMADHTLRCVGQEFSIAVDAMRNPSAIYRPTLSIDGNKWCALYGEDLQCGVAGFGDSPAEAMADFDANWNAKLQQRIAA